MATLYCGCGCRIWSDLWRTEGGAVMLFMDNQPYGEGYGERVEDCPGCGKKLRLELLSSDEHPRSPGN